MLTDAGRLTARQLYTGPAAGDAVVVKWLPAERGIVRRLRMAVVEEAGVLARIAREVDVRVVRAAARARIDTLRRARLVLEALESRRRKLYIELVSTARAESDPFAITSTRPAHHDRQATQAEAARTENLPQFGDGLVRGHGA